MSGVSPVARVMCLEQEEQVINVLVRVPLPQHPVVCFVTVVARVEKLAVAALGVNVGEAGEDEDCEEEGDACHAPCIIDNPPSNVDR